MPCTEAADGGWLHVIELPRNRNAAQTSGGQFLDFLNVVFRKSRIALREETGRELFDLAKQATAAFPGLFDIVGGDRLISVGDMTSLQFKPTYNITTGPCELVITKLQ